MIKNYFFHFDKDAINTKKSIHGLLICVRSPFESACASKSCDECFHAKVVLLF